MGPACFHAAGFLVAGFGVDKNPLSYPGLSTWVGLVLAGAGARRRGGGDLAGLAKPTPEDAQAFKQHSMVLL